MEDDNKIKKIITFIIIITIIIGISIAGFFIYQKIMSDKNRNDLFTYLKKNGYTKSDDKIYTKKITENKIATTYYYYTDSYVLTKEIYDISNSKEEIIAMMTYKNDDSIEMDYVVTGLTKSRSYGSIAHTATYDKNNKFTCKIIKNSGFTTRCSTIKNQMIAFQKEVKEILKNSNVKAKYIK